MKEQKKYDWMVYVSCATFNHAPFIVDAMDSFTMQETSFPFICTIVDDASTDGEQDVIKKYLEDNFELDDKSIVRNEETDDYILTFARHKTNHNCFFAVLFLKYNHYSVKKSKFPYIAEWRDNCKFIAFCEGDDYWTDSRKLQRQVEAMDAHPELDISAHTFIRTHALTGELVDERILSPVDKVFSMEQVIMGEGGFVGTPTLMVRKSLYDRKKDMPFWNNMDYDYTLQMAGTLRGGMLYLKDCMVNKRTRVPGSFTSKHRTSNKNFRVDYNERKNRMLEQLDEDTDGKYHKIIYARLLLNNIRNYNTSKENRIYWKRYNEGLEVIGIAKKVRLMALSYLPFASMIYRFVK